MRRVLFAVAALASAAAASEREGLGDLTQLSIQELMNIEVTSVAKKEQKLSRTPAAVFVITQDDIRRSGASSIPEVLRLVPGLQVARIDSYQWAITSRGFSGRWANKLQVLVDGRSAYARSFAGVYWDLQDAVLEDIERIEVIRGPGATMWGANAVNGVINIITRHSRDTLGGLAATIAGTEDRSIGELRYGARLGSKGWGRLSTRYLERRSPNSGQWGGLRGGFRTDWELSSADSLMVSGEMYGNDQRGRGRLRDGFGYRSIENLTHSSGGNVLGRWKHVVSEKSDMALQIGYDGYERRDTFIGDALRSGYLDYQYRRAVSGRHELLMGAEVRLSRDRVADSVVSFVPSSGSQGQLGVFLQDEIALVPDRLSVTAGTKLERNSLSGAALQPSLQVAWTPNPRRTLWGSVARAVRDVSRYERDLRVTLFEQGPGGLPLLLNLSGNPQLAREGVLATEFGARFQLRRRVTLDVSAFRDNYHNLQSVTLGDIRFAMAPAPHLQVPLWLTNGMAALTYGVEAAGHWQVARPLRLSAGYAWLEMRFRSDVATSTLDAIYPDRPARLRSPHEMRAGESPRHQGHVRSSLELRRGVSLDTTLYLVDRLPAQPVPGYARLDAHLAWRAGPHLEISGGGANLVGKRRPEYIPVFDLGSTESDRFGRSLYAKIVWRF